MFCTKCGGELKEGDNHCGKCGAVILSGPERHVAPILRRLSNYVIDIVLAVVSIFIAVFLGILFLGILSKNLADNESAVAFIKGFQRVVLALLPFLYIPIYYTFFESIWQRTPGKWATKTKVVCLDGSKPSFLRILGRSFARIIPFEAFSYLFGEYPWGWHDQLSKTAVVPADYTAEDVKAINPRSRGKSGSVGIIIGIVFGLLMVIAIIGILSSVVLVSLSSARAKGKDAALKANLMNIRVNAELYRSEHNDQYLPASNCDTGIFADNNISQQIDVIQKTNTLPACKASATSFAISAPLSDKSIFCVDSNGYGDTGAISTDQNGEIACDTNGATATESSTTSEDGWVLYTPTTNGFSVKLPENPKVEITSDKGAKQESYTASDSEGASYFVVHYKYVSLKDDGKGFLLKQVFKSISKVEGTTVLSSENKTIDGRDAISFKFKVGDEYVEGALIKDADDAVYLVMYDYFDYNDADYQKFMTSLSIK